MSTNIALFITSAIWLLPGWWVANVSTFGNLSGNLTRHHVETATAHSAARYLPFGEILSNNLVE